MLEFQIDLQVLSLQMKSKPRKRELSFATNNYKKYIYIEYEANNKTPSRSITSFNRT